MLAKLEESQSGLISMCGMCSVLFLGCFVVQNNNTAMAEGLSTVYTCAA